MAKHVRWNLQSSLQKTLFNLLKVVSVRSNKNLHFHGTSNTSKKLYHLQISKNFTSSKNDNFENCRTSKNVFYIFQGLLHFEYDFNIFKNCVFWNVVQRPSSWRHLHVEVGTAPCGLCFLVLLTCDYALLILTEPLFHLLMMRLVV